MQRGMELGDGQGKAIGGMGSPQLDGWCCAVIEPIVVSGNWIQCKRRSYC